MTTKPSMRYILTIISMLWMLAATAQKKSFIVCYNPLPLERPDELIVLTRTFLESKLGKIKAGQFIMLNDKNNRPLVVQLDDMDGDGSWEQAAFVYSFKAREKATLTVSLSDRPAAVKAIVRAHVRLRKKNTDESFGSSLSREIMPIRNPATDFAKQPLPLYLTEGPAWENDKVAFRQYMDVRNGRDIFGKRVGHMVMDSVGVVVAPSYHDLADWGMDVLHVGKSLGAGSIAFKLNIDGKDSLIRLGGDDIKETVFELLCDGPVRAAFRMNYSWQVAGKKIQVTDETSIWAGQYFYESKISVKGMPANANLVAGIANFNENTARHFIDNQQAVLYSHGRQSENKDALGMAIIAPSKNFAGFGITPDSGAAITYTYTLAQHVKTKPVAYRFYAGWIMSDKRFASKQYFENFLKKEAAKINADIHVR